ncbi:glutamine--fructose-6-phosphate transaminase (isomerizing) [Candidatus Micrarchaeota archaeon]|nr:glutamine--fructose-6-phosphate transaminase (isomerizing) [Candidatus Micrarchaeota archaeon]MBU1166736.1 glutamine--fructose-6-phosphate transaminase (isomerizing) [Candidatus Micrarchaeota archaeon]MBU1886699.1 glutamine--fructose-6-phosphate transaminase (isomerizing) [Candidatus Micrarchaeota archaeon]
MCGIIGYVGNRRAAEVLIEGLKRLEYRGYDSVGVAIANAGTIEVRKDKGMIEFVSAQLDFISIDGHIGIGHTRWATHGAPCKENAHPHASLDNKVILAHNGVIENFTQLKNDLKTKGHTFRSETDSEVIAHQIAEHVNSMPPLKAFLKTLNELEGSYGIAAIFADDKDEQIFVARRNSPLVLGIGKGEMFCASDIPAMLKYTKTFVPLEDGDIAVLSANGYKVYTLDGSETKRKQITVDWNVEMAQKGGYPYFMLKEINDQRHFINETIASDVVVAKKLIEESERIDIVACGTSYHAGLMFSYLLQQRGKSAQAFIASDYPFIVKPNQKTLVVTLTQSGETADVLQAVRYAKKSGCKLIAITNVVGSTITNIADNVVYLNTGPEVGVAATKTFTAQLAIIYKIIFGKEKISSLSDLFAQMMEKENEVKQIAAQLKEKQNLFFIGRGISVPIAYEGSLKLKEISYIHSEAYPGGELKHGTLSLIENGVPVIVLAPTDDTLPKLFGNLKEAKTRGALIISLTNDEKTKAESNFYIELPILDPDLYPFAMVIILQLLAYHVSVLKGINPDRPRNLAKSVTVE